MKNKERNLILKITEKCLTLNEHEEECFGLRHYLYQTNKNMVNESIVDFIKNFDSDNILDGSNQDEFDGECLDSEILKIEVLSEGESKNWY